MMLNVETLNGWASGTLPGLIGVEITAVEAGLVEARIQIRPDHLAPNGYLHAATVVALADTAAGYGTLASLPEGAAGFTTIELKANYVGTAREGEITCRTTLEHGGKRTQVWDADISREDGKRIALFRCTQTILY